MTLVLKPTEFDVILTENLFGDILSDQTGGSWVRLACSLRPASEARSVSTNPSMDQLPTLQVRVLPIR